MKLFSLKITSGKSPCDQGVINRMTSQVRTKQSRFKEGDTWRHAKDTSLRRRKHRKAQVWASKYM